MLLFLSLLTSCNEAGYALVSISPIYGYTDGCNAVTLAGHGFGDKLSATIGGAAVPGFAASADKALLGYQAGGTVPAGAHGFADIVLTSDGVASTLSGTGGYYYVECPAAGTIVSVSPAAELAAGVVVTLDGCGLDAAAVTARIVDAAGVAVGADMPLTTVCGTGAVSFVAPALADGTYYLEIVDLGTGMVLSGAPCGPIDSADTGSSCTDYSLTYGVAP
ncbi:MAG: hypothetical protein EXR71_18385 [Myxococcales bacterium]|nr:hypothetical protein [Myxococcales bacterium]